MTTPAPFGFPGGMPGGAAPAPFAGGMPQQAAAPMPQQGGGAFVLNIPEDPNWEPFETTDVLEKDGFYMGVITKEAPRGDNSKPQLVLTIEIQDADAKGKNLTKFMPHSEIHQSNTWFLWRGLMRSIMGDTSAGKRGWQYVSGQNMLVGKTVYFRTEPYVSREGSVSTSVKDWQTRAEYEEAVRTNRHRWASKPPAAGGGAGALPGGLPGGMPGGGMPALPGAPTGAFPGAGPAAMPGIPQPAGTPMQGYANPPQPQPAPMQAAPTQQAPSAVPVMPQQLPVTAPQMPPQPAFAPQPGPGAPGFGFPAAPNGAAPGVPQPPPTAAGLTAGFPGVTR